jgi:hypothetical protein
MSIKNKNMKGKRLIEALEAKYKSEMLDALARLEIYLTNPVGIGEHPQHTEEMDKIVGQYMDGSDKLNALKEMVEEIK